MPMIEFRYNPETVSRVQAAKLGDALEEALRSAIREVRPSHEKAYRVFIEGDPFDIQHNQPDLRIYVFYHQEWDFGQEEVTRLSEVMVRVLEPTLKSADLDGRSGKIRFYIRAGYAGVSFGA